MKTNLLIIILLILLFSCGTSKKTPPVQTKDTTKLSHERIPDTTVLSDTIPRMTIPPPDNYKNKKSPALTNWIKKNLTKSEEEFDSIPSLELLKVIDVEVLPENRGMTRGKYFTTLSDSNICIVAIEANCSDYNQILILFKINRANYTIQKFTTFYGEDCAGTDSNYGGSYSSFSSFGNYFCINVFHSSYGMEDMSLIIINDNFKEVRWLGGSYSFQQELEKEGEYSDMMQEYDYSWRNDTLVQHCHLHGKKYKKKMDVEMDIRYKCLQDSMVCLDKDLLKKHDKAVEEMNNW